MDDLDNYPKRVPSQAGQKKDQGHSDKNSHHPKGHETGDIDMGSAIETGSSSSRSGSTGTGASSSLSSQN